MCLGVVGRGWRDIGVVGVMAWLLAALNLVAAPLIESEIELFQIYKTSLHNLHDSVYPATAMKAIHDMSAFGAPFPEQCRIVTVKFQTVAALKTFVRALGPHRATVRAVKTVVEKFSHQSEQAWAHFWKGMPQYKNEPSGHFAAFSFAIDRSDAGVWERMLRQKLWAGRHEGFSHKFPPQARRTTVSLRFVSTITLRPRYPVYVVSKGRWESRYTSRALDKLAVPYKIVVEPQEYTAYCAVIDPVKVLKLPFSNLGRGSIPARNWIWDHAKGTGANRHWILDDNIKYFFRRNRSRKVRCDTGNIFRATEDLVDRYENVAMAGFHYQQFLPDRQQFPPMFLNTRVYSCILLDNKTDAQWRGKFNEDTDLSLRFLKAGFCTLILNAFLIAKTPTMRLAGGNTTDVYADKSRLQFAKSLQKQHPDVTRVAKRFGRWHHIVNYAPFKSNALITVQGATPGNSAKYHMPDTPRTRSD